jgi:hypothetical protein
VAHPKAPPSSGRRRALLLALAVLVGATPVRATSEGAVTARLHVSPLVVVLELSASTIRIGESVTARVTATNIGPETLRSVSLNVRFEPVGLVPRGATTTRLNQLKGGRSAEASFRLCAAATGSYLILAQAQLDGVTIESPARLLSVVDGRQAKC